MFKKVNPIGIALWLALFGAMVGSIQHVAWSFATLSNMNTLSGYIQAVALDIGLTGVTFGIQQRKRAGRDNKLLWVGVVLFSGVSTYANLLYGFAHLNDIGVEWLAQARPWVMSAVLPLMVIFLSEVVSEDVQFAQKEAEKERRRAAKKQRSTVQKSVQSSVQIEQSPDMSKEDVLQYILQIIDTEGDINITRVAEHTNRSRTTIYNYLDGLQAQGYIVNDNDSWAVVRH